MSTYTSRKWSLELYNRLKIYTLKYSRGKTLTPNKSLTPVSGGQTMPALTSIQIGSAKRMDAAILFLDLVNFTSITSRLSNESTLNILNLILPTTIHIVKEWKGEIEKNTGDGIMAILGTETKRREIIAMDAVECALTIRYLMINDIQPALSNLGLPPMQFRIGVDMDEVLIARIGIPNNSFLSAIGDAANRAAKLQGRAQVNGICIGDNVFSFMPDQLKHHCSLGNDPDWGWKTVAGIPYRYFHLDYDWPKPEKKLTPIQPPSLPSPFQFRK
jgi:class 3 adenylate cyclase